jgi:Phosphotransferase enzyme family
MHDRPDPPPESCRLLLLRSAAEEVLLCSDHGRFQLPQMGLPANERIAASLNRTVERELGLEVISLYEVSSADPQSPEIFYHAAVSARPDDDIPPGTCWMEVDSLAPDSFRRGADFQALLRFQSDLTAMEDGGQSEPFRNPNWFLRVTAWVSKALRPCGLQLSGAFQQLNASATFSLIRFETNGRPVWFKAVGEPNTREFHLTLELSRKCTEYLPKVLAHNAAWNAWLAEEAAGIPLSPQVEFRHWESAAESLARLQIMALPHAGELSAAGARNLSPSALLSRVAPFCEFIARGAERSGSIRGVQLRNGHPVELGLAIEDALRQLDRLHLPETLGHMDLSPQNIFCKGEACVFLDWAEGFTGCPFFAFEYLVQHFRRFFQANPSLEVQLRDRYLRSFQPLLSKPDLESVLTLCPLAALFAYASTLFSSHLERGSITTAEETYLLGLARKMYRMAARERGVRL